MKTDYSVIVHLDGDTIAVPFTKDGISPHGGSLMFLQADCGGPSYGRGWGRDTVVTPEIETNVGTTVFVAQLDATPTWLVPGQTYYERPIAYPETDLGACTAQTVSGTRPIALYPFKVYDLSVFTWPIYW